MLQFNKKLTALALLSVTSITGTMLIIANVSAQSQSSGGITAVTLWNNSNRKGEKFDSNEGVPDLSQVGFDDKASAIRVSSIKKWRFYKDKNFKGKSIDIGPNQGRSNLGQFNDQISSFKSLP